MSKAIDIQEKAKQWLDQGYTDSKIKEELLKFGVEERNLQDIFKEVLKLKRSRNTAKGLIFILAGAALCLISCVFTIMSSDTNVGFMLYGVTSIGIVIVFIGLIKIFG